MMKIKFVGSHRHSAYRSIFSVVLENTIVLCRLIDTIIKKRFFQSLLLSSSTSHRLKTLFGPNKIHLHQKYTKRIHEYTLYWNRFCSVCRFNGVQSKILIQFLCHHFCIKPMDFLAVRHCQISFFFVSLIHSIAFYRLFV